MRSNKTRNSDGTFNEVKKCAIFIKHEIIYNSPGLLDLQLFRIRKQIENEGLQWHEDNNGRVRIWIRLKKKNMNEITRTRILPYPDPHSFI